MTQKNTGFVSDIDQFLKTYDKQHPGLSETQKKELAKYKRVYLLRDDPEHQYELKSLNNWFDNHE